MEDAFKISIHAGYVPVPMAGATSEQILSYMNLNKDRALLDVDFWHFFVKGLHPEYNDKDGYHMVFMHGYINHLKGKRAPEEYFNHLINEQ